MEYKCKLISLNSLIVGTEGVCSSLCDSCSNDTCSNPIEKRKISVLGILKEMKVYSRRYDSLFVIDCVGYINEKV
jgi:hypothetical protein